MEALRRVAILVLTTTALISTARFGILAGAVGAAAALAAYILIPREQLPPDALVFDRMPAVIGPDILGLFLGSVFLALPVWASIFEGESWTSIHPSAVLSWPMSLGGIAILVIAGVHAAYWVRIEPDGLHIANYRSEQRLAFADVRHDEPHRRGLPRAVRWLTPLLVATGRYTQAGAILLARDTTGMRLVTDDPAQSVIITQEGFETPFRKIVGALRKAGVPIQQS